MIPLSPTGLWLAVIAIPTSHWSEAVHQAIFVLAVLAWLGLRDPDAARPLQVGCIFVRCACAQAVGLARAHDGGQIRVLLTVDLAGAHVHFPPVRHLVPFLVGIGM